MLHSKLLSQLFTCASKISSYSKYCCDQKIQVKTLDQIAMLMPISETLKVPRDGSFEDTKTQAIDALTKDMTKIMRELPPMPPAPPKVVDENYSKSAFGETVALMVYVDFTQSCIDGADMNLEIYEKAERNKKAKLNNGKNSGLLAAEKARKLELQNKMAIAQTRLAYVKEALERREWNFKIKSIVDYNSDSEDID